MERAGNMLRGGQIERSRMLTNKDFSRMSRDYNPGGKEKL